MIIQMMRIKKIYNSLERLIKKESSFHFYLKNHPRFNNEIDLNQLLSFPNVSLFLGDLKKGIYYLLTSSNRLLYSNI